MFSLFLTYQTNVYLERETFFFHKLNMPPSAETILKGNTVVRKCNGAQKSRLVPLIRRRHPQGDTKTGINTPVRPKVHHPALPSLFLSLLKFSKLLHLHQAPGNLSLF